MKKPPLWASLFTLLGFAILCALGFWQLERLEWKTRLIAEIEEADAADPMAFELTRANLTRLPQDQDFVKGYVKGRYLHDREMLLGPRTHEGRPGYHVITPFATLTDEILLVNRGWIPLDLQEFSRPAAMITITGTARRPGPDNRFVPENQPADNKWFRLDLDQMAKARGLAGVLPFILYAEGHDSRAYPLAAATKWRPRNSHLSYAVFWFTMAGALAMIFGLRFLPAGRKE